MDRRYCVYKHTTPNGKVYIGITRRNPITRWQNGNGYKRNKHFMGAILKYGWDNIKHEILFSGLTEQEAKKHLSEIKSKTVCSIDSLGNKKTYKSMIEAEKFTGVSRSAISKTCRGILKQAKGFKFCYVNNVNG